MRLALRVLAAACILAAVFLAGFILWGNWFDRLFSPDFLSQWFGRIRPWAWAAGIGLLVADLVLPIPATGVMAALGTVYGPVVGGLVGMAGSTSAGLAGYGLARLGGRRLVRLIAKGEELERFKAFFDRWGGLAVIVSRAAPVLPEVIAILAGLAGMRLGRFAAGLLAGSAGTALLFAWLGHASREEPWWGMAVAVAVPAALWPVIARLASDTGSGGRRE